MLSSADTEYETSSAKCGVNDEKLFMCRSGGGGFCERPRWRSEVAKPRADAESGSGLIAMHAIEAADHLRLCRVATRIVSFPKQLFTFWPSY